MKKIFRFAICVAIIGFIVSSCSSSKVTTTVGNTSKVGTQQPSLSNTSWDVMGSPATNARPYISFDPENGMVGNAGCNRIFSQNIVIQSKVGDFSVKNIGSTRMACPSMDMSYESNFISMLESANKYVVTNNILELYKNNILLMKFQKTN